MIIYVIGRRSSEFGNSMTVQHVTDDIEASVQQALEAGLWFRTEVWYEGLCICEMYAENFDEYTIMPELVISNTYGGSDTDYGIDVEEKRKCEKKIDDLGQKWITMYRRGSLARDLQQ